MTYPKTPYKMKNLIKQQTLLGNAVVGATNGKLFIEEAPNAFVDELVKKYHYSHKTTKNRFKSFLVNKDKGFLQLGYGIRPKLKHTISHLITENNFCEFDRMWLSDELPKNSESQVISLLLFYLKNVYPKIKFVITYADGSVGNKGIIYQATNAFFVGKIPVDFYELASGERIHPVSMYHRHKTRAQGFLEKRYKGIKHIKGGEYQYRYLYVLSNYLRKKFQAEKRFCSTKEGLGQFQVSAQSKNSMKKPL